MKDIRVGFALCGSFCTLSKVILQMKNLVDEGANVIPIMSETVYNTDTRFGKAEDFIREVEGICNNSIIHTIAQAEPIGPKKLLDLLIVAPCTGNTIGKMANGITDSSVTMASKAHLRNDRPVLLAVSTNDALAAAAKNIGVLMNSHNIYFVPMKQDDYASKPNSIVADFEQIIPAAKEALNGKQIQPII